MRQGPCHDLVRSFEGAPLIQNENCRVRVQTWDGDKIPGGDITIPFGSAIVAMAAAIVTMAIVAAVAAVVGRSGRRRRRRNRRSR